MKASWNLGSPFDAVFAEIRFVFKKQQVCDLSGGIVSVFASRAGVRISGWIKRLLEPVDPAVVYACGDELIVDLALVFEHH